MSERPGAGQHEPEYTLDREIRGSFLGRDSSGKSSLIIPVTAARPPLDRATGDVHLAFRAEGSFSIDGREFRSPAALIRCENAGLAQTFVVLATDLAERLRADQERPAPQDVSRILSRWEELLRGRKHMSRDEEIGLWGELWTLLQLHDLSRGLAAWRGPDAEQVDFVGGGIGLECKAGMRRLEHWISQEQVSRPLGDAEVFLLSLWIGLDAVGGSTLGELVAQTDAIVDEASVFEEKLLSAGYSRADAHRYRLKLRVLEPPMLFRMSSLPRVRVADPGVSHIRYLASLEEDFALRADEAVSVLARLCEA